MNNLKRLFLITALLAFATAGAQTTPAGQLSLQQAVDFAKKNNPNLQNADLDVKIAKQQVNEVASAGLPQISASVDYTGNPQIATTVVPNFINPGQGPATLEFQMGISHTLSGKINANWLLLDGTYFLGLKAATQYVSMASLVRANTAVETEINVTKAYYLALIADESDVLIQSNIDALQKTYDDTKALYETGFVEEIDKQRLELQLSNLKTQQTRIKDQKEISYRILKFQMGMKLDSNVVLSDSLLGLISKVTPLSASDSIQYDARPEYRILQQQTVLNLLNTRRYQFGYLPSLSAFGSHQQNSFALKDNFSELGTKFYGGTTWGLSLKIPIFDGMYKHSLIQQTRLESLKTQNELFNLERAIENDVFQSKRNYLTALKAYEDQNKNYELAKHIRDIANTKQEQGVGSSLEVTNANNDLKTAENNYLTAIYDLLVAEVNYKKALGKIQ